jgi:PAS domain S-box-containing protein
MAPNTALSFWLAGVTLGILDARVKILCMVREVLAVTVLLIGYVAVTGYVLGATALYGVAGYSSMAIHTAFGFVALAIGLLASRSHHRIVKILSQHTLAGVALRRVLPLLVAVPLAVASVCLAGQRAGFYGTEFGLALMVTVCTCVIVALALWNARRQGIAEDERERASEQFRLAIEAAPTGMVMIDRTGAIVLVTAQIESVFGYRRDELLGKPIEMLVPERFRGRHPAHRADFFDNPKTRSMGAGRELYGLRKDGAEVPIEIGLNPLRTSEGDFVLGSVVDISQRKQIERMRERDRFFQLSIDMVCIADTKGRFLQLNPAFEEVLGHSNEELLAQPFLDFVHPDDLPGTLREVERLSAGHATIDFKNRYRCKDGTYKWLQWRSSPHPTGLIYAVARDVTEDTEMSEALRQSLRERGVLLQEVHHRVKNNLQVISSLINLQIRKLEAGTSRDALEECQTRVQAIALIHEKLYQSKDYAQIPFSDYARSLASNVFHASGVSPGTVLLDLAIEDLALAVDKAIPCGLVLNELITNSLKHGFGQGRSGTIRVELATLEGGRLLLAVRDNGVGLPVGMDVRKTESLGLQLVCTLAQQLEAELEVSGGGDGASFELTFPCGGLK